jgi:hypothetical protein
MRDRLRPGADTLDSLDSPDSLDSLLRYRASCHSQEDVFQIDIGLVE